MPPRLVRRKPFMERLSSMLNPMDFLLWLSEEMETWDWESRISGTQLGVILNFTFLLVRANSGSSVSDDDIFSDDAGSGWLAFLISSIVWGLVILSCSNAFYALTRTRKYRLFGVDIETKPSTPSARRVKISSSSSNSSPLKYVSDMIASEPADSRAHPNKAEDVWELSVWDPLPLSLRLFCLFSPGHVLFYLIFLPLEPLHPRPSITVFNTLLLQAILSCQLLFFSAQFAQQAKDNSIVQREVMHEYDTKYVHPRLHPVVRDAGTQISEDQPAHAREFVQVGTPTTLIHHSIHSRQSSQATPAEGTPASTSFATPRMFTPTTPARRSEVHVSSERSRPSTSRRSMPAGYTSSGALAAGIPSSATTGNLLASTTKGNLPASAAKGNLTASTTTGNLNFGGHMGINAHAESPLRKATSLYNMNDVGQASPRNSREMASYEQQGRHRHVRQSSPVKRVNELPGSSRPNPFAPSSRTTSSSSERYPSMW